MFYSCKFFFARYFWKRLSKENFPVCHYLLRFRSPHRTEKKSSQVCFLQSFDTAGWLTGRTCDPLKPVLFIPKGPVREHVKEVKRGNQIIHIHLGSGRWKVVSHCWPYRQKLSMSLTVQLPSTADVDGAIDSHCFSVARVHSLLKSPARTQQADTCPCQCYIAKDL